MTTMIEAAIAGWTEGEAGKPGALFSSEIWFGYRAGQIARSAGFGRPVRVKMSRGYSVRIKTASEYAGRRITFKGCDLDHITNEVDYGA